MSTNSIVLNNGQELFVNFDVSKIFIWGNRYENAPYINSTYNDVTLLAGTLMGRVSANGYIKPLTSGASDGSQFPVGILANDVVVVAGSLVSLPICNDGDVREDLVIFQSGDNMDTVVSSRRLRDRISSDTVGIRLVPNTEMTGVDNQ
jgi:hypothetical protein